MESVLSGVAGVLLAKLFPGKKKKKQKQQAAGPPKGTVSKKQFDASFAKLKKEHEAERAKWRASQAQYESKMDSKYSAQMERQAAQTKQEMAAKQKEIESMHSVTQLAQRLKEEEHKVAQIRSLVAQRAAYVDQAQPVVAALRALDARFAKVSGQIAVEGEMISKFTHERRGDPARHKLLVTLGATGVGKSTFCNRIVGDGSEEGDERAFGVAKGLNFDSHTSFISKQTILLANTGTGKAGARGSAGNGRNDEMQWGSNARASGMGAVMDGGDERRNGRGQSALYQSGRAMGGMSSVTAGGGSEHVTPGGGSDHGGSDRDGGGDSKEAEMDCDAIPKVTIVDTPGFEDTKGRDSQHGNNLCEYLRGCGGVNAFLVFFSCAEPRFTTWYKNLLNKYMEMLGEGFWNHVIIIATKGENIKQQGIEAYKRSLSNKFKEEFNLNHLTKSSGLDLPVVISGHHMYQCSLKELFAIIPKNKYDCDAITSPINKMKDEEKVVKVERSGLARKLQKIYSKCGAMEGEIHSLTNYLNDNDAQIRNLQCALEKPVRRSKYYDFHKHLPPLAQCLGNFMGDMADADGANADKPKHKGNGGLYGGYGDPQMYGGYKDQKEDEYENPNGSSFGGSGGGSAFGQSPNLDARNQGDNGNGHGLGHAHDKHRDHSLFNEYYDPPSQRYNDRAPSSGGSGNGSGKSPAIDDASQALAYKLYITDGACAQGVSPNELNSHNFGNNSSKRNYGATPGSHNHDRNSGTRGGNGDGITEEERQYFRQINGRH